MSSPGPGVRSAHARVGTLARSILWQRGCSCLVSGRRQGCCTTSWASTKSMLRQSGWGWATATDDAEGEPLTAGAFVDPGDREILAAMGHLTGRIEQVPSSVSAIKVKGVRAYQRGGGGEAGGVGAGRVQVSVFDRVARRAGVGWVDLDVRVVCSSGTYIRA